MRLSCLDFPVLKLISFRSLNGRLRTINFKILNAEEKRNKAALLGDQDVQALRKRIKDKVAS